MDQEIMKQLMAAMQETNQRVLEQNQLLMNQLKTNSTAGNTSCIPPFELFIPEKETFRLYKERFENYLKIKNVFHDKKFATELLLNSIGSSVYSTLSAVVAPNKVTDFDFNTLIKKLEDYFCPKKNVLVSQHKFLSTFQEANQSISDYISILRQSTLDCELATACQCKKYLQNCFTNTIHQRH